MKKAEIAMMEYLWADFREEAWKDSGKQHNFY